MSQISMFRCQSGPINRESVASFTTVPMGVANALENPKYSISGNRTTGREWASFLPSFNQQQLLLPSFLRLLCCGGQRPAQQGHSQHTPTNSKAPCRFKYWADGRNEGNYGEEKEGGIESLLYFLFLVLRLQVLTWIQQSRKVEIITYVRLSVSVDKRIPK